MENWIYLDNNATTVVDERVLQAMIPYFRSNYGNASSNHEFGANINHSVKESRAKVAALLGAQSNEIVFTSGATESVNLAIKGLALLQAKGNHIITTRTEHPAVLDACKFLEGQGYDVTYLNVNGDGLIDIDELQSTIRKETVLVSVMAVNNETGVIQPIQQASEIAHSNGALMMTDATQAVGKVPFDVDKLGLDLVAFSGHKFYGPKGVGALFVRSRRPNRAKLMPLFHGGGHEKGFRSGTLNVPGIIGLATALEICYSEMVDNERKIRKLRDQLEKSLLEMENTSLNGSNTERIYNVSNICFHGADADAIIVGLQSIMVSNGSACSSFKVEPSHVLKAMGRTDEDAYSSIRFSLGKFNTESDVEKTLKEVKRVVSDLRVMSD